MFKELKKDAEKRMAKAVEVLRSEFASLRGGRARVDLVASLKVECYGGMYPLKEIANLSAPEANLIIIEPWDKAIILEIEKAILKSNLGISPSNDGNVIRLPIPPLSEERRKEITRLAKERAEEARVAIRNIRREIRDKLKSMKNEGTLSEDEERRGEKELQEITDRFIEKIAELEKKKIEELMEV